MLCKDERQSERRQACFGCFSKLSKRWEKKEEEGGWTQRGEWKICLHILLSLFSSFLSWSLASSSHVFYPLSRQDDRIEEKRMVRRGITCVYVCCVCEMRQTHTQQKGKEEWNTYTHTHLDCASPLFFDHYFVGSPFSSVASIPYALLSFFMSALTIMTEGWWEWRVVRKVKGKNVSQRLGIGENREQRTLLKIII